MRLCAEFIAANHFTLTGDKFNVLVMTTRNLRLTGSGFTYELYNYIITFERRRRGRECYIGSKEKKKEETEGEEELTI